MASSLPVPGTAPVATNDVWTVSRILEWTTRYLKEHGSDTPRLDSEILLAHTRKCKRIQLYTSFDSPLTDDERAQMRDLVKRRANAEPVAYLVGHREFFGLDFLVTKDVLIPRPDTETLIVQLLECAKQVGEQSQKSADSTTSQPAAESIASKSSPAESVATDSTTTELSESASSTAATGIANSAVDTQTAVDPASTEDVILDQVSTESTPVDAETIEPRPEPVRVTPKPGKNAAELQILDLCTGSGCIAITTAVNLPKARILATDISPAALAMATENATRHKVTDRIAFASGNLFNAVPTEHRFHLIVSNPPYIPEGEIAGLDPDVKNHEPLLALQAGPDGMQFLTPIVESAARFLLPGGWLLMETGIEQAALTEQLLQKQPTFHEVRVVKDLGGRPRVVMAQLRGAVSG